MIAMMSIVLVTEALFALNFCSFFLRAPLHILAPGMRRTPAKRLPTILPSTRRPFCSVNAIPYNIISMIEPNVALMTAPMPIEDCALMDATAMPMKYDKGMTLARLITKIMIRLATTWRMNGGVFPEASRFSLNGRRMKASAMAKKTTAIRLTKKMFTPPTVYL